MNSLITSIISITDMKNGLKKWIENTTKSPSGRHLGHYKAFLTFDDNTDKELEDFNIEMLTIYNTIVNASIFLGTPIMRWKESIAVMIEKIQGNTKHMKLIITSFSNIFGLTKQHIVQNNSIFLVKHNGVQDQCLVQK